MTVLMAFPFDRRTKHLRILLHIRSRGPLRFNQAVERLRMTPTETQRTLRDLQDDLLIHARPYTKRGEKLLVEYDISKRGEAYLRAFDAFKKTLESEGRAIGADAVRELRALE